MIKVIRKIGIKIYIDKLFILISTPETGDDKIVPHPVDDTIVGSEEPQLTTDVGYTGDNA